MDNVLLRTFGYSYLRFTRPRTVSDRLEFIREYFPGGDVLDVGCGSAGSYFALAERGRGLRRYLGVDIDVDRLSRRIPRAEFRQVDLRRADEIGLGQFDVVLCLEVIEHLIDHEQVMRLIARSCRPGGMLLLSTPSVDFVDHFKMLFPQQFITTVVEDGGHVRDGYSEQGLRDLLVRSGFEVERFLGVSRFDEHSLRGYLSLKDRRAQVLYNLRHRRQGAGRVWSHAVVAKRVLN